MSKQHRKAEQWYLSLNITDILDFIPVLQILWENVLLQHVKSMTVSLNRCAKVVVGIKFIFKQHTLQEKNLHGWMLPGGAVL